MTEVLPPVYLELVDSEWPPATSHTPAGTSEVGAWSVERELVGNVLPGNVRARSGLSIGVAKASIRQAAGKPLAPWVVEPTRRVQVGGAARLYTDDGHELGDWIVDPSSGALTSPQVDVDLVEAQYVGRQQPNTLPASFMLTPAAQPAAADPVWIVHTLAQQAGYHAVPPPVASTLLALPMQGSAWPDRTTVAAASTSVAGPDSWDRSTGPVSPVGAMSFYSDIDGELFGSTAPVYLTANVLGTVRFDLGFGAESPSVELRPGGVFAVRSTQAAAWVTESYVTGESADWPLRVQVEMERLGVPGAWTGFRARARSGPDAAYSAHATSILDSTAADVGYRVYTTVSAASSVSGVQITTTEDLELWAALTADLDPIGGGILAPWLPGDLDAWTGIQQVCASHLAAAWVGQDRILRCRDRSYAAGVGTPGEPLDVADVAEDIAWSIDPSDQADRLEVTYAPADVEHQVLSGPTPWPIGPTVWEAPDVLEIPAGATVEIVAEVPFYADLSRINTWIPAWDTDNLWKGSIWSALPNRDGTGTQPPDTALAISGTTTSAGRVVLAITNTTAGTLYTVDANGAAALILTAPTVVRQDVTATVAHGLPETQARNPVTIDLGRHVQRQADAAAIAEYIWVRISSPMWKASSVRVALDWSRDIGDIIRLEHPDSDLSAKALVTKVALDATPGEVAQSLDLVLLPPTWDGFDLAWVEQTWDDFDAHWLGRTWNDDFDLDPLATGA